MPSKRMLEVSTGQTIQRLPPARGKSVSPDSFVPENEEVARLQKDVRKSFDDLLRNTPFGRGRLLEVEFTAAGTISVKHGLGSPASGFIVCDKVQYGTSTATADIFRETVNSVAPTYGDTAETHIQLRCNAACKAKVWVW